MKCIKILSIVVALSGLTAVSSAQTLQDVIEARNNGSDFLGANDLDGAISELEKCVELAKQVGEEAEEHQVLAESALPDLYLKKANTINATRDYPATLKALEATVAAAEKYSNAGVKEKAEKIIPTVYLAVGTAEYSAKNYEEAIKNLDQAIERDPNMARAYFLKGASYQQMRDDAKMEDSYRLAIEKGTAAGDASSVQSAKTQLSRFFLNTGITAQKTKKWDDAITAFTKTIEVDDANADAYYSLLVSYVEKKSWDNAIALEEKVLELKSGDGAYYFLASAYLGKNNNAKACEYFKMVGEGTYLNSAKHYIEHTLKCK